MGKTVSILLAAAALAATPAFAQNDKPSAPSNSGFFFTDEGELAMLQYIEPGAKLPAFQMFCPKGSGKIAFDEIAGAPADGPITWTSAGKSFTMEGKRAVTPKGTPYARANTSTAQAAVLGLRDTFRVEITAPGTHYTAQATEGDRSEIGVFFTNCDEGDSL